jgi:hypothetical protein
MVESDNPIRHAFMRAKYGVFYLTAEPICGMCFVNENMYENTKRISSTLVCI